MDSELDQVICTVLSLEEEYSALSQPLRNQENAIHKSPDPLSYVKTQDDLPSSDLQQVLLELYTLLENQEGAPTCKLMDPVEPMVRLPSSMDTRECFSTSHLPLKRKFCEGENKITKKPRVETEDPKTTSSTNRCRKRAMYSKEQTDFLLNQFCCDPYPDFVRRCQIASITGISEPRIQVWFQNRRSRHPLQLSKTQDPERTKSLYNGGVCKIYTENPPNLQFCGGGGVESPEDMWMVLNTASVLY